MKTSTKLLTAAAALLLGSLLSYDLALSAEYRTGHYKNPFYGYTPLSLSGFNEIAVPAASRFSIAIKRGPYAVHLNDEATKYVRITRQGPRLTVALAYPEKEEHLGNRQTVIISCPELRQLSTDAPASVAGNRPEGGCFVTLEALQQDSLTVRAGHNSSVRLWGSALGHFRALMTDRSHLSLEKTNRIQSADLAIGAGGELEQECGIAQPHYQFARNTSVHFEGAAAYGLGAMK